MREFEIVTGLERMQMGAVMALLKTTHWAAHRSETQERLTMEHSFLTHCSGIFEASWSAATLSTPT